MGDFTMGVTVATPYEATVDRVRELLGQAGFGVLTEIDVAATLRSKIGVETAPRVILGACRPELAYRALEADSRVATMLPCNVVVAADPAGTRVEIFDPEFIHAFSDDPVLVEVGAEARQRLGTVLSALNKEA